MGYRLTRMSYSSIIRESEDFGCAICDHERRQLCESTQSTPLQSGPLPGYLRGIDRRFAEVGDEWRPGDVVIHNHPYYGASPSARRRASSSRSSSATSSSGSRRRPRTISTSGRSPRARAASSTRPTPTPRACCSTRSRSRRRAGRCGRSGRSLRRQHAPAQARRRRHGGAGRRGQARRRPHARARRPLRAGDVPGRRRAAHGPFRAERCGGASPQLPDGRYERRGHARRLPRPSRSRATASCRSGWPITVAGSDLHVDLTGHRAAGRPADQHAARRHRRHRRLRSRVRAILLGLHAPTAGRLQRRPVPADHRSSRPRARSPTRCSRRRRSPASAPATRSPTR